MKLLARMGNVGKRLHLSPRTIDCYQRWVKALSLFLQAGRWLTIDN
jgi:hypothetical protein